MSSPKKSTKTNAVQTQQEKQEKYRQAIEASLVPGQDGGLFLPLTSKPDATSAVQKTSSISTEGSPFAKAKTRDQSSGRESNAGKTNAPLDQDRQQGEGKDRAQKTEPQRRLLRDTVKGLIRRK